MISLVVDVVVFVKLEKDGGFILFVSVDFCCFWFSVKFVTFWDVEWAAWEVG